MSTTVATTIVAAILALILGAVLSFIMRRRARREDARRRYGAEYDRTSEELGSGQEAERDLRKRREWMEGEIQPLSEDSRKRFDARWQRVERNFLNDPGTALEEADRMVAEVLAERNYPVDSRREARKGLGVMHPRIVEDYLEAQRIHQESSGSSEQPASLEKMRQAIRKYRAVYGCLKKN